MNESKRLTHYMTVSAIGFHHNLRLSTAPAHAQARGIRTYLLCRRDHQPELSGFRWKGVPAGASIMARYVPGRNKLVPITTASPIR
jgi:hypothetical protein